MKKQIQVSVLLIGLIFVTGCQKNESQSTSVTIEQEPNIQQESEVNSELSKYGAKTETRRGVNDLPQLNGPEIGSGKLFNDAPDKSFGNWQFTVLGTRANPNEINYSLIIDENCFIHTLGFKNGSCEKYLSLNKDIKYDGMNGPSVSIYGEILANQSIQVSDITLQQ